MNGSPTFLFSRRTIIRALLIIGIGFVLTAVAVRVFAQEIHPGVVPDDSSQWTYAANFKAVSPIPRVPVTNTGSRVIYHQVSNAPDEILPGGESVGVVRSTQPGYYQYP